jgi:hypothetical protein
MATLTWSSMTCTWIAVVSFKQQDTALAGRVDRAAGTSEHRRLEPR